MPHKVWYIKGTIVSQILMMLFYSLSLPFTLLNLEWILNTTSRLFTNVKETSTYDFIVIGGGNAYVCFSLWIYLLIDR